MPRAYTLTQRPPNLSAVAKLMHRLRHPLRTQRVRQSSITPSHLPSARTGPDKRRPRVKNEWLEASTSRSPHHLCEIQDKGEYTEQRYGDVDTYWNSVMVEANEDEQFQNKRSRSQRIANTYIAKPAEQTYISLAPPATDLTQSDHTVTPYAYVRTVDIDDNSDRLITLTTTTRNASPTHDLTSDYLTWNSALNAILASPFIDPSVSAAVRSRARSRPDGEVGVDKRDVGMVPNFSYPIASAAWCELCDIADWP